MIVQRFYNPMLAQASYLLGCSRTGSAVVIDPNRDTEQYLEAASRYGVSITHVTETHIHADFVSGARELAARTGATLYLSDEGDAAWKYAYASDAHTVLVHHGDTFSVGNVRIEVVHTPGHTPEHISFLVTDGAVANVPISIVTGDFVFVGDVGRPDLLEKAAKVTGAMEPAARTLFRSLQRFKQYPDWLQIWPGHGAGSACGKGLSAIPHSTVGYERQFNWALGISDEDEFVRTVLAGQPEPPAYFATMKRINKMGPPLRHGTAQPERLPASRLGGLLAEHALVVDTRSAVDYAAGSIPGTLNIPLNGSFTTWAGWLLPYDRAIYLIVEDQHLDDIVCNLAMIGLDQVAGYFGGEAISEWAASGQELDVITQLSVADLKALMSNAEPSILDVRWQAEWDAGHLPFAHHIPLGYLSERLNEVPQDRLLVVQCQSGARSAIAASLLRWHGISNVVNLTGGIMAWQTAGYPTTHDTTPQ